MSKQLAVSILGSIVAIVVGLALPSSAEAGSARVSLCHLNDEGSYHMITVSQNAVPAHRAHGDGLVGEDVPGLDGYVFGEGCTLIAPSADPIVPGCYSSSLGWGDLRYLGPADTAGNVVAWPSMDGSCSGVFSLSENEAIVNAVDAVDAATKCTALGMTVSFLGPLSGPNLGYPGFPSTAWYCNAP